MYKKDHHLLRVVRSREEFGEHRAVQAAVQAAQQAFADDADRGGEDGAAVQPGAGSDSLVLGVKALFRL